ncbi:MAG: acetyl-CoA C-acetyltransferase [Deltaproteobacteria bacterium]|nr:acetyl-CoA C-acetyltransferase [Deltaproteobacteria bacterium]MCB9786627.1 acetyl-CoA C-acetyltransferase [Deltaproteobacteria bacterium]
MMDAFILDAVRTPRGKAKDAGSLHKVKPIELIAGLMRAAQGRNALPSAEVDDVILGCVTATGEQGANIAKIAALYAGWNHHVSGVTINRFCASGLSAVGMAATQVSTGMAGLVVAGGVESLSRVPMYSDGGAWFSDPDVARVSGFINMGISADLIATLEGYERAELDAYGLRSQQRARAARDTNRFRRSLVPVDDEEGRPLLARDELIRDTASLAELASMPALFTRIGTQGANDLALSRYPEAQKIRHLHHLGTSPSLADGASLVLVGNRAKAHALGLRARARIRAVANYSVEPVIMLTGNVEASQRALRLAGAETRDVDLFEVNESFASVMLHYIRALDVDEERFNVNGGAIAMGHPLGATGGMLVATVLDELERRDKTLGLVSICGGAGVATAMVIERV